MTSLREKIIIAKHMNSLGVLFLSQADLIRVEPVYIARLSEPYIVPEKFYTASQANDCGVLYI